jgi:hypothetical protein
MAPSGLGRCTLGILRVPTQAGLRGTNVHVFRFLGRSSNRGIYAPLSTPDITGRYAIFSLFT